MVAFRQAYARKTDASVRSEMMVLKSYKTYGIVGIRRRI